MRYTTIIDISESSTLYKSANCRLLYLHLILKCGYHDDDRDLLHTSFASMASSLGITLSACRHAVSMLERAGLLKRDGNVWLVKKFVAQEPITPRPKTVKTAKQSDVIKRRQQDQERRELEIEQSRHERELLEKKGKTPFMVYYEGLLAKAANGDMEAADAVKRQAKMYEQHKQAMKK